MAAGRPPNIMRPVQLTTTLPEDLRAKLDLHLYSTVEGRVPHGAYSRFLAERIREFFDPQSPANQLTALRKRVEEAEISDGFTDEQRWALQVFRDHILGT